MQVRYDRALLLIAARAFDELAGQVVPDVQPPPTGAVKLDGHLLGIASLATSG